MAAKILVVDDDPNVQRLLQYSLRQEGYEVVIAGDGAEGFRLWGAEAPDLILLDVMTFVRFAGSQRPVLPLPRPAIPRAARPPPSLRPRARAGVVYCVRPMPRCWPPPTELRPPSEQRCDAPPTPG